jgi:hypothetical protein
MNRPNSESENSQKPQLSVDFCTDFSSLSTLTPEEYAEIEANEHLEATERGIAEFEERNRAQTPAMTRTEIIKLTVKAAKASHEAKPKISASRVGTTKQNEIAEYRRGEGRESYNAYHRKRYGILIEITENRPVRLYTDLAEMTPDEKAEYLRENAKERKRKSRAEAAKHLHK